VSLLERNVDTGAISSVGWHRVARGNWAFRSLQQFNNPHSIQTVECTTAKNPVPPGSSRNDRNPRLSSLALLHQHAALLVDNCSGDRRVVRPEFHLRTAGSRFHRDAHNTSGHSAV